ncbi:MAG: M48 family metallopeptidase [Anaeromyxobacter sp.]
MPASSASDLRLSFVKALVLPALTFLLVPLLAIGFVRYGEGQLDDSIQASIVASLAADRSLAPEERAAIGDFYAQHPASAACRDGAGDPRLERLREVTCKPLEDVWQFVAAERLAMAAAALGVAALLGAGLLGLVAFWSRRAQYWSFMLGWRSLQIVTALETVAQGALLVWLSYWVTALLFERYFPKLILIMAIVAGLAVLAIVLALFKKVPPPEPLEGERIEEAQAPGLWRRLRELAARVGTTPPDTLVGGIDDNFFVTEQPLELVGGGTTGRRVLFVSLPLLRILDASEADAVFGHELAHLRGGDTAASARLYPALVRYAGYQQALAEGGLTVPAAMVMRLYRAIFELAVKRDQRRRELLADAEAVRVTSPDDLGRSLLKITGYSSFRAETERALFEQRAVHEGALALGGRIDQGLGAHAASEGFQETVRTQRIPHPFDSHPPLEDRLAAAGARVAVADAAGLLQQRPAATWLDEVPVAPEIEARLWDAYEARFKAVHEESLAWRYLPATAEEQALVERYFPARAFPAKEGEVRLTWEALTGPDGAAVLLAGIEKAKVEDGTFSKRLELQLRDGGKFKLDLKPLGDAQKEFLAAFGRYWQRAQAVRAQRAA